MPIEYMRMSYSGAHRSSISVLDATDWNNWSWLFPVAESFHIWCCLTYPDRSMECNQMNEEFMNEAGDNLEVKLGSTV